MFLSWISFVSHNQKNFNGNSSMFQKNTGSENFLWMLGAISRFYVEVFLSHSTVRNDWETRRCFTIYLRQFSCIAQVALSFVENFSPHRIDTKSFVTFPSVFQKTSVLENIDWATERGWITNFRRIFSSHSAEKIFWRTLQGFRNLLVLRKIMDERGVMRFFRRSFFESQYQEFSLAALRCFRKFLAKTFNGCKGDITYSLHK